MRHPTGWLKRLGSLSKNIFWSPTHPPLAPPKERMDGWLIMTGIMGTGAEKNCFQAKELQPVNPLSQKRQVATGLNPPREVSR